MVLKLKNIPASPFTEPARSIERKLQYDMHEVFWKKPNISIDLDDLNKNNIHLNVKSFTSKQRQLGDYLIKHQNRLQNLVNDMNKLIQPSRLKDVNIHVELVDRNHKEKNNPEYLIKDQHPKFINSKKPNGYMAFSNKIDHYQKPSDIDPLGLYAQLNVTDIHIKAILHSPATLVHEFAHTIDLAYGQSGLDDPDNSFIYRSNNDPNFKQIQNDFKEKMLTYYQEANPDTSITELESRYENDPYIQYFTKPTELHSRLFEIFYNDEIESIRNKQLGIQDINEIHIYDRFNPKYGKINQDTEEIALHAIYMDNDYIKDWFKCTYNQILPENHPEYDIYKNKTFDELQKEKQETQNLNEPINIEYPNISNEQTGITDQQLLDRYEASAAILLNPTPSIPSNDLQMGE